MTFRLPRLPETAEIVEANRRPSFKFQRWWQSIVSKLEAQENRQDALAADILSALAQAGIAVDTANAALDAAGAIMPDIAPITIQAGYTGAVLDGQLPRSIAAQRFAGDIDVTTDAEWSATLLAGGATFTIGAATGVLNLTALETSSVIEIASEYDGITRSKKLSITKQLADPPPASGAAVTYDSTIVETTSNVYGAANTETLTITCGSSGEIECSAPLQLSADAPTTGFYGAAGKWQYREAGDVTWIDVGTEIDDAVPCQINTGVLVSSGYIEVNQTQSGLTASADYEFQLLLRNDFASGDTVYYVGTASVTTS